LSDQKLTWAQVDSFIGNHTSPALTFHRPCPICGSLKFKSVLELNDFQFYSDSATEPKRVDIRENMCMECGALYLNPCYSDHGFQVLFAEAGQSYGSTEGRPTEQIDWLMSRDLLGGGSSLLDVGCYEGSFLSRLPSHVRKLGVDIDQPAIERGRQKAHGESIEFFHGDFEHFEFRGDSPTVITMFHVLEHLPRPVQVLKKLAAISTEDTNLVVEVPILENGKTNDINGFFSVQHMTHFTRASLKNALRLGGWMVLEQQEQPGYNGCRVLAKKLPAGEPVGLDVALAKDWEALTAYFVAWYSAINHVQSRIRAMPSEEKTVIWGGGAHTEFLYHTTTLFSTDSQHQFLIVDSDTLKHGKTWRGITISSPDILRGADWGNMNLLVSSYGGQSSIVAAARGLCVPRENIVQIYDEVHRY